jgi:hypothetical protein
MKDDPSSPPNKEDAERNPDTGWLEENNPLASAWLLALVGVTAWGAMISFVMS